MIRLAKESSSSSRAEDEVFATGAEPINLADTAATIATPRAVRPSQRGIMIREHVVIREPTS